MEGRGWKCGSVGKGVAPGAVLGWVRAECKGRPWGEGRGWDGEVGGFEGFRVDLEVLLVLDFDHGWTHGLSALSVNCVDWGLAE